TTAVQTLNLNWGDGTNAPETYSGSSPISRTHQFSTTTTDTTYMVEASVVDVTGRASESLTFPVAIQVIPPSVLATCTPLNLIAGETTSCTLTATEGTFPIESFTWSWGDSSD